MGGGGIRNRANMASQSLTAHLETHGEVVQYSSVPFYTHAHTHRSNTVSQQSWLLVRPRGSRVRAQSQASELCDTSKSA